MADEPIYTLKMLQDLGDQMGRRDIQVRIDQILAFAPAMRRGYPKDSGPTDLLMIGGSTITVTGGYLYWQTRCELIKRTGVDPDPDAARNPEPTYSTPIPHPGSGKDRGSMRVEEDGSLTMRASRIEIVEADRHD